MSEYIDAIKTALKRITHTHIVWVLSIIAIILMFVFDVDTMIGRNHNGTLDRLPIILFLLSVSAAINITSVDTLIGRNYGFVTALAYEFMLFVLSYLFIRPIVVQILFYTCVMTAIYVYENKSNVIDTIMYALLSILTFSAAYMICDDFGMIYALLSILVATFPFSEIRKKQLMMHGSRVRSLFAPYTRH